MKPIVYTLGVLMSMYACSNGQNKETAPSMTAQDPNKVVKTSEEWKKELDGLTFHVTRENGTEPAFSGKYDKFYKKGSYYCSNCGALLFSSEHKFDSRSGWPSFYTVSEGGSVGEMEDRSHGMLRTEVICKRCDAHLGHVFDDGPDPTGMRYCINSVALDFKAAEDSSGGNQ